MTNELWPIFDLRITTPRLVMRLATDAELAELVKISDASMFDPERGMPFVAPWPLLPSPDRERSMYQFQTGARANWKPQHWMLLMTAFLDGQPIGLQDVTAKDFGLLRTVSTGSWIGAAWQRQGLGTEMRAALLELVFGELGALEAHSSYREDNPGSSGVSAKLGYVENGRRIEKFGDEAATDRRVVLTRQAWTEHRTPGIIVEGIDECRSFFGGNGETWQTV